MHLQTEHSASTQLQGWAITRKGRRGIVRLIPEDELPSDVVLPNDMTQLEIVARDVPPPSRTYNHVIAQTSMPPSSKVTHTRTGIKLLEPAAIPVHSSYPHPPPPRPVAPLPGISTTIQSFRAPDDIVRRALRRDAEDTTQNGFIRHHHSSSIPSAAGGAMSQESWRSRQPDPSDALGVSVSDAIASTDRAAAERIGYYGIKSPAPSGIEPDPTKKVYCTFWIRTGECDYTQQGCMYKHEMPDLPKLRELGFLEVPRWWKEKNGIRVGSTTTPLVRDPGWMKKRFENTSSDHNLVQQDEHSSSDESGLSSESDGFDDGKDQKTAGSKVTTAKTKTGSRPTYREAPKVPRVQARSELAPSAPSSSTSASSGFSPPLMLAMPRDLIIGSKHLIPSSNEPLICFEDEELQSMDELRTCTPTKQSRNAADNLLPQGVCKHGAQRSDIAEPNIASRASTAHPSPRAGRDTTATHVSVGSPLTAAPQQKRDRRFRGKDVSKDGISGSKYAPPASEASRAKVVTALHSPLGSNQVHNSRLTQMQGHVAKPQLSRSAGRNPQAPLRPKNPESSGKDILPPSNSGGRKKTTPKDTIRKFVPAAQKQLTTPNAR